VNTTKSDFQDQLGSVFARLDRVDLYGLPWAWCVKQVPSRARHWLLNRVFRIGYGLALICMGTFRFLRFGMPGQSNQTLALTLILRAVSRLHTRMVRGNIERFRQSILAILCPSSRDDLVAAIASEAQGSAGRPGFVWIAHRTVSPATCRRIVFYVHGGGFVKGDLAAFHHGCSTFSREFHALTAFPLYPLCPEHPLEQAVREIHASYCRVRREFPSAELVIMADSAGGLLAALLLRSIHKHGLPMPQALVLLSPLLELHRTSASGAASGVRDPVLDGELLDWLCSLARQNADPAGIRLDWNALGYFPPTCLVASHSERLRDDSKRLEAAGSGPAGSARTGLERVLAWTASRLSSLAPLSSRSAGRNRRHPRVASRVVNGATLARKRTACPTSPSE
jgi:acetyl esterase/lipase